MMSQKIPRGTPIVDLSDTGTMRERIAQCQDRDGICSRATTCGRSRSRARRGSVGCAAEPAPPRHPGWYAVPARICPGGAHGIRMRSGERDHAAADAVDTVTRTSSASWLGSDAARPRRAPEDQVLAAWSGLGYYRRARMLHAGARVVAERSAMLPIARAPRAAGSVVTRGCDREHRYGSRWPGRRQRRSRVVALFVIDEDMKRVGCVAPRSSRQLVPASSVTGTGVMELGATVCTPRAPACDRCPVPPRVARASRPRERAARHRREDQAEGQRVQASSRRSTAACSSRVAARRSVRGLWSRVVHGGPRAKDDLCARFRSIGRATRRVTHVLSHRRLTSTCLPGRFPRILGAKLPEVYEAADLFDEASLEQLASHADAQGPPCSADLTRTTRSGRRGALWIVYR